MSQENAEITRRSIDVYNNRDLDAYDEIWTEDYESLPARAGKSTATPSEGAVASKPCDFRDGRISRARAFMTHEEALEAVGLEE